MIVPVASAACSCHERMWSAPTHMAAAISAATPASTIRATSSTSAACGKTSVSSPSAAPAMNR